MCCINSSYKFWCGAIKQQNKFWCGAMKQQNKFWCEEIFLYLCGMKLCNIQQYGEQSIQTKNL